MDDVIADANTVHILDRFAAAQIPFGSLVNRTAAGTVSVAPDGANTIDYDGVAVNAQDEKDIDGFYAQYDAVPVAACGVVQLMVIGGGTDLTSGNFVEIGNDFGWVQVESGGAGVRDTSTTVAVCLEDAEISDYTLTSMTGTINTKTVTVGASATTYLSQGDYVYLVSSELSTGEIKVVDTVDSATQFTLKENLSITHATSGVVYIGRQVKALLMR